MSEAEQNEIELKPDDKVDPLDKLQEAMQAYIEPILLCVYQGMIASLMQVGLKRTLLMICGVTGRIMAKIYAGDAALVYEFRMAARKAFVEGLKSVPPQPLPKQN